MKSMKNIKLLLILGLIVQIMAGCNYRRYLSFESDSNPTYYYINPGKNLRLISRVAFIELNNKTVYPDIPEKTSNALFKEIQKKQLFGIHLIESDNRIWKNLNEIHAPNQLLASQDVFGLSSGLTLEQLAEMREALASDAILVGMITQYSPFPHATIGLRLKMIDLNDGELIWGYEQVWDGSDISTQMQIEEYYCSQKKSGPGDLREKLATISSVEFLKFVSFQVADTLR